jgi:mono/diheme cytochrome c family protein
MSLLKLIPLTAAVLFLAATPGMAIDPEPGYKADPAHGLDLAKRWCASCHVVSEDQQRAVADVPPFASIAQKPHVDAEALANFLLDPHPKMPDLPLSRTAADDIAAYITSLGQPGSAPENARTAAEPHHVRRHHRQRHRAAARKCRATSSQCTSDWSDPYWSGESRRPRPCRHAPR